VLLVFDGFEVPYIFRWPPGPEKYEGAIKFRAKVEGKVSQYTLPSARESFGTLRKRVFIVVKHRPMLELASTDNYDETDYLIGVLKKPRSEEHYRPGDAIPVELSRFTIVFHKHYIKNGFNSLAVLFSTADIEGMIEYRLIRAKLERRSSHRTKNHGF